MSHTMYSVCVGASQRMTEDPLTALAWAVDGGPDAIVTARTPGHGMGRIVWTPETAKRCVGTLYEDVISTATATSRALKDIRG